MAALFAVIGCKDDGGGGGGKDDSDSNDTATTEMDALLQRIADLEAALSNATDTDIATLQAELAAALDELEDLQTCANGGDCEELENAQDSLTAITDAYCEWMFACCSASEMNATFGNAIVDEDSCKAYLAGMMERSNTDVTIAGVGSLPVSMDKLAGGLYQVEMGAALFNADNVEACAEEIAAGECGDAEPSLPEETCGDVAISACSMLFEGLKQEGEPCVYAWGDIQVDECADGLECRNNREFGGICMRYSESGDLCSNNDDCQAVDGSLYCDDSAGSCAVRPVIGETCAFEDPSLDVSTTTRIPCQSGSFCSPEGNVCVDDSSCGKSAVGDKCLRDSNCAKDAYCDKTKFADNSLMGQCVSKKNKGVELLNYGVAARECKSGGYYQETVYRCAGVGGDACDAGNECMSGVCHPLAAICRTKCSIDAECATGESCYSGACYEDVQEDADCEADVQCPDTQMCSSDVCTDKLKLGVACSDGQCAEGLYCSGVSLGCLPVEGQDDGEACSAWWHCKSERCDSINDTCLAEGAGIAIGDDCEYVFSTNIAVDPCVAGAFCRPVDPTDDDSTDGVCTAQAAPGSVCDLDVDTDLRRCKGNAPCVRIYDSISGAYLRDGDYICPVVRKDIDDDPSCVLNVLPVFNINM